MNEDLRRFLMVAHEGHLTRTAEKLFITQSALTQSIHRLEKQLKTKLFAQHGKQLQLTSEGNMLVLIAEKIQSLWHSATASNLKEVQMPTYTIGMFDNVALRLSSFFHSHIQTDAYKLELTISSSGRLLAQLRLGTLDAAICVIDKAASLNTHVTLLHSFTELLLPVSAREFSGDVGAIPFILYNKGSHTRNQIDTVFLKHGIEPTIFAESTSTTFMKELALLGSGVALLPENVVRTEIDQGKLKKQKIPLHWQREYGLFLNKESSLMKEKEILNQIAALLQQST